MSFWWPIDNTLVRRSSQLMASCNSTLVADLGLSRAPTLGMENGALGMDTTTSIPLHSHPMHVDTQTNSIPQDKVINIHEDLAHLQKKLMS